MLLLHLANEIFWREHWYMVNHIYTVNQGHVAGIIIMYKLAWIKTFSNNYAIVLHVKQNIIVIAI